MFCIGYKSFSKIHNHLETRFIGNIKTVTSSEIEEMHDTKSK